MGAFLRWLGNALLLILIVPFGLARIFDEPFFNPLFYVVIWLWRLAFD